VLASPSACVWSVDVRVLQCFVVCCGCGVVCFSVLECAPACCVVF